ncbi:hypothetical protein PHYSODRAFT_481939 [Phytophthora sojae]|uniref:Uncharacterized protein n=1 Tax=Phytophthora sojae (strain P6497) TaxID=1094619 RepID=G4YYN0_PHYSP|nr:hypothetical protein PHYSODRAFT_481939 [Phytophthora sojae]EGZ25148.1 hypothetical protein PHYSODRAFT_481939 [Phytophthora sojae]|eukprot:XP_009520436.1 hypothetical protein PHYSODRAFT_481939 [Phytophthora sojae]
MAAESEEQHDATVQGRVTGIIYPPPDIRAVVDKTAQFVANNGRAFESRIVGERMSAKFSFLRESDPYHAYYEHKVSEFIAKKNEPPPAPEEPQQQQQEHAAEQQTQQQPEQDKTQEVVKAAESSGDVVVEKKAVQDVTAQVAKKIKEKELEPPPEEKFIIKHPSLSALDQEIMYLTAQYTALSGSSFLSGLATREQRNPQFDFLKPTHPLFAYFTALVESYTLVLAKQDAQMKRIEEGMERMKVLDRCVHRMEWQRTEQERKDKEAAESDAERRALAQIDWHDFVVVETITFDGDDDLGAAAAAGDGEAKGSDDEDMDMEEDDDDEPKPGIKVVENYVPQATAMTAQQPLLSVDGKTLSSAEANEHMRILLMNPKWREETQRHLEKQKESSYAAGSAIADSLRRFATKRADIFASSAEEEARLLQATTAPTAAEQQQRQQQQQHQEPREDDMEEDSDEEEKKSAPAEEAPSQPGFSEAGQLPPGAPMAQPPPGMSAPMVSVPMMGAPGMGAGSGPPSMMPPHMQVAPGMSSGPPGIGAGPPGVSGPPGEDLEPAAKRQRTGGSSLLPENEFAIRHPGAVRLVVKVPNDPDNAQWKLEGQTLNVEVDVKDNMRTLKQKLMVSFLAVLQCSPPLTMLSILQADLQNMPVNKQQLKFSMGFVKDTLTCAHYNFVNGTVLELSVRQRGGRR